MYVHEFRNGRKKLNVIHTTVPPDYVLSRLKYQGKFEIRSTYLDLHNWV